MTVKIKIVHILSLTFLLILIFPLIVHSIHTVLRTFEDRHLHKFLNSKNQSTIYPFPTLPASKLRRFSYYGEVCANTDDCAPNQGLICKDSSCVCISPEFIARLNSDRTIERRARTECVLRAGSTCPPSDITQRVTVNRAFSSYFWNKIKKNIPVLIDGVEEHFVNHDSHCVDNAHCIGGTCKCAADFFKDQRGLCLKKRTLFQPCEDLNDEQCRASEGLRCNRGTCQCKQSMVFDEIARKCFIPIGGKCDAYSSHPEEYEMKCVRDAECSNDHCVCLDGYTKSSDGTCGVAYGRYCTERDKICSDIQLTCRSGQCQCRYPVHQVYNASLETCLSKPDGPCLPDSITDLEASLGQGCVHNAECLWMKDAPPVKKSIFEYVCKCIQGYAENSAGECMPSYSSNCVDDDDCDNIGQLSCVNGKCSCPDGMLTWDDTRRKCVGIPGARCKIIQLERILSMKMDIPSECVENAVCKEYVTRLDGRCECLMGHQFSSNYMKCTNSI